METLVITNTHLLIGGALLIVGLAIGTLLGRRISPQSQKSRDVERKLDQVLQDKKAYEDEVVEHFTDTAKMLNSLTESYRDVHNHLAKGAAELCQGQGPVIMGRLGNDAASAEIPAQLAGIQPPWTTHRKHRPMKKACSTNPSAWSVKRKHRQPRRMSRNGPRYSRC